MFVCMKQRTVPSLTRDKNVDKIAVIAFGSNLGNRSSNIKKAIAELKNYAKILKVSRIIETKPEGYANQAKFLNGVVIVETKLTPARLLATLKRIEKNTGRKKTFENGPRKIDLDIIFYDDKIIQTRSLKIPHPKAHTRKFVMKPLCKLAPHFEHPKLKKTVTEIYRKLLTLKHKPV